MQPAASNDSYKYFKRVRSCLINPERCSAASPSCHGQQRPSVSTGRDGYGNLHLEIIAMALCFLTPMHAQEATLTSRTGQPGITIEEVIVTGSNIPTAEEIGPNPVDTYRPADIEKLGIHNTTDLLTKLPQEMGSTVNQNIANMGDGSVIPNLRGLLAKETLVLIDGKRVAIVGGGGTGTGGGPG